MQMMENRRLQGKSALLKKLQRNQDFMIGQTLSPTSQNLTKWHKERELNSEYVRDLTNAKNKRYIEVSNYPKIPC